MGSILKGKELREFYIENLRKTVNKRLKNGKDIPCLTAVLIGNDGGSIFYVDYQKKMCDKVGIKFNLIHLSEDTTEEMAISVIKELNMDTKVHGIILQLPLPKHLNSEKIITYIDPEKDVDALTDVNISKLFKGEKCFIPCTSKGIMEIVKSTGTSIEGKRVVIIGRSNIVGKPSGILFLNEDATVTICHSKTKDLSKITKEADILVVSIGVPEYIKREYIKEGAIVIDVGTTNVNGKMKGDVDFEDVIDKASYLTPVPGGVGSVTTMMLIQNTVEAAERYDE